MSCANYAGSAARTFSAAIVHLLETDYGVLGSRRVLELLATDLEALAEEFYPRPERLASGWLVFTGTKATGPKAHPGQTAADYELVTLAWPVVVAADVQRMAQLPRGKAGQQARKALLQDRLARVVAYGWQHPAGPVVLTQADLGVMFNLTPTYVGALLQQARQSSGKPLLTKGYYFDQGMRPTHKAEVIALYEAGLDELTIAQQTNHAQTSVGQYIRDYERVKLLVTHHTPLARLPQLLAMQPTVVRAYLALLFEYHPDLQSEDVSPTGT